MENESDGVTKTSVIQSHLLMQTLKSWRFFLLFTLPPLAWVLIAAQPGIVRMAMAMIGGVIWLSCWRLWLDVQYFSVINEENNARAGAALCSIWQREKLQALTFTQRQQGALKQFRRTLYWIVLLWLSWLILLLFH
ncbi:hypothetical protein C3432_23315 [Citrobacter amalonaticus]|uniref:Uncharacterized protein n=1 Tax=Citrobacter amalonaticus TaxID=35703 RepID=A0A2S4S1C3_CITAM|nr:hypothetical protein [Citrobacter amalonaticus]POT55221.1 hypothetical protein C3432_23315 [Citrobacter amalonaticus]POT77171.1 hypothetical protein C3436_06980 [Citrobacter amalonaticus]POU67622.1 hypothetical protein C3430_00515 [Citrobacter amalonaticus]POV07227.1 hypothetical protein C3424_00525 [Citrobacter amalonaticus]